MTQEKPLKGISDDIAEYLGVSGKTARRILRQYHVPTFKVGRYTSCYASTLKKMLEGTPETHDDPSTDPPVTTH